MKIAEFQPPEFKEKDVRMFNYRFREWLRRRGFTSEREASMRTVNRNKRGKK